MRNNQRRTGRSGRPQPPAPASTSALAYTVPTEFVELPSRGLFYPEDHPLFNQETVEIKFMTAKDEDILSSQALIKKGIVIDRLLESLLVLDIDPESLLIGDKNAIMLAARMSSYGSEYKMSLVCPMCLSKSKETYDLKQYETKDGCFDEGLMSDKGVVYNAQFRSLDLELPVSKVKVSIAPGTGYEEKQYLKSGNEEENTSVTSLLKSFIVKIGESTEYNDICRFIDTMPAFDSKLLRELYFLLVPNIELKNFFMCQMCMLQETMEVPLTAEFFWPR